MKRENLCKIWALKIYENTQVQIAFQDTKQ